MRRSLMATEMSDAAQTPMAKAFFLAKLLCFALCLVLFIWKVCDSVVALNEEATGSQTDLRPIKNLPLPMVTVCRHPYQVL